jgi:hypothetical protein
MTIQTLMRERAALTAQLDAIPDDHASEPKFKETFAHRWAIEESVLSSTALTLADRDAQIEILAGRAHDGLDVADELTQLVA